MAVCHRNFARWLAVLLLPSFTGLGAGEAAELLTRVWQTEQGLPQNTVTCVLQTRDGYLWLGTRHGIARFDGARFLAFNSSNTPAFRSDHVSALAEDGGGNLWVGTEGGGAVRLSGGGFRNFSVADGLASDTVRCLAADGADGLWIGTVYGLHYFDGTRFTSYSTKDGLPGNSVRALAVDAEGALWIGTEAGVARRRNGEIQALTFNRFPVEALTADPAGDVWISGKAYGLLRARAGRSPVEQILPLGVLAAVSEGGGERRVAMADDRLLAIREGRPRELTAAGLPEGGVRCLYTDREDNLWAGMNTGGLARIKLRELTAFSKEEGLPPGAVHAVAEDGEGRIWAAPEAGGLALFQDGRFHLIDPGGGFPAKAPVSVLRGMTDGSLWIGTRGNGLYRWSEGNITVPGAGRGTSAAVIDALLEEPDGTVWAGTEAEGVLRWRNKVFTRFTRRDGLSADQANCMARQPDGSLWFGTANAGLNRFKNGKIESFSVKDGLAGDAIRALCVDRQGLLWIGAAAGLTVFRDGRFLKIPVFAGAGGGGGVVSQILEDDAGNLWLGTNRGLLKTARRDLLEAAGGDGAGIAEAAAVSYGTADGMPSAECVSGRQSAATRDGAGRLWFGTLGGLARVDSPGWTVGEQPEAPPASLERVFVNGVEALPDRLVYGEERPRPETLTLPPGGAPLEFHFTAPSFRSPEKIRFRYRLEGFDAGWIHSGDVRRALYSRLPAGDYRFRVEARGDGGVWSAEAAGAAVRALPRYYETGWFKAALAASGGLLLAGAAWLRRTRRLALERMRMRIAGDLHDELGGNLSGIALLSGRVSRQDSLGERERRELREISSIARQTIAAAREIVWFINPACDTLEEMTRRMRETAAVMLVETDFVFEVTPEAGAQRITPEFRRNMFLTYKETLHNIVRHSGARRVEIRLEIDGKVCRISVGDDGRGMDAAAWESGGTGLKNARFRLAQMKGVFTIDSTPGAGTTVRFAAAFA